MNEAFKFSIGQPVLSVREDIYYRVIARHKGLLDTTWYSLYNHYDVIIRQRQEIELIPMKFCADFLKQFIHIISINSIKPKSARRSI